MNVFVFDVKGSSGNGYKVRFEIDGLTAHAYCNCQAGVSGQYCKHRLAIIDHDASAILGDSQRDFLALHEALTGTALLAAARQFRQAEEVHDAAKSDLDRARGALTRAMYR